MSQQVYDIDTVGYKDFSMGEFFDFYVNNTFYLLAPEYYYQFYSTYLNRCLSIFDGWVGGFHNTKSGLVPQRMLQSIANGLANMLFAHGVDFNGDKANYDFATKWAKKSKFYKAIKKAYKFAIAGGTSLLKTNRKDKELYCTAHRMDTFFVDVDSTGKVVSAKIYFDAIHNTNATGSKTHYGICEERYFNKEGRPCVKSSVYTSTSLQTESMSRPSAPTEASNWKELPQAVRKHIKQNYPDIVIGAEQYLPFPNSLGLRLIKFTDEIPQFPNLPFGQPIGDILFTENFQYDQMKYFEKNEVDLARARALIPEEMWNKDDPDYEDRALSDRFYQKVGTSNGDNDKVTPIQFLLRGEEIRVQKENIFKDCAFKLQVSASSIASFLNEGAGARTATEILNEKTKTDTWIDGAINLNAPEIDEALKEIMYYYNRDAVEIVFRAEDQSPYIERLKANGDAFAAGNMSPRRFVKDTYKHLTVKEQNDEIEYLEETKAMNDAVQNASVISMSGQKPPTNQ